VLDDGGLVRRCGFILALMMPGLTLLVVTGVWVAYGMLVGVGGARVTRRQAVELALLLVGPIWNRNGNAAHIGPALHAGAPRRIRVAGGARAKATPQRRL
jgi:hypothetical protein